MMAAGRDPSAFPNPTEEERRYLGELAHWTREETGYQWIQGTRPQTLAFALDRFAGGPRCLDRGEVPRLVGLRWRRRARDQPRPHARRYLALLVYRRDRLVVLALLCPPSRLGDPAARRDHHGADRLRAIPARNPQAAAQRRGARVHRTFAAGASWQRAGILRRSNSPSCSPTRCAPSSGNCDEIRKEADRWGAASAAAPLRIS